MAATKNRKRIYVDRHVQGGIVFRLMALWLASTALAVGVWLLMQVFSNPTEGMAYHLENAQRHITPLVLAFAVTLPIAVLHLMRFTHRFAGPVVRLRRELHDLANGEDVPTLMFRDNDYWQDLAGEYNRVAKLLSDSRRRVAELEEQLEPSTEPSTAHDSPVALV